MSTSGYIIDEVLQYLVQTTSRLTLQKREQVEILMDSGQFEGVDSKSAGCQIGTPGEEVENWQLKSLIIDFW